MMLLGSIYVNAQIDNVAAPNFTGTDVLTGEEVSLQAYLDQGKTVVAYMSAAWCGPCWSFHNTHYLTDIYNAFGKNGSDEVVIVYIEADWRTPVDHIKGIPTPVTGLPAGVPAPPMPLGDWTEDTPYLIINNDQVAEQYDIPGFPTMFAICPSGVPGQPGIAKEIERGTPAQLTESMTTACGAIEGLDHWAKVTTQDLRYCDAEAPVSAYVESYGHALSSVQAQLTKDGEVVATQTFSDLNAKGFQTVKITFDDVQGEANADYKVTLLNINDGAPVTTFPEFNTSEEFNISPLASVESYNNVKITLNTDEYPEEIALYIIYYDGDVAKVAYQTPSYPAIAANREKTFTYYTTLNANECYGVVLQDAYGDGWNYNQSGPEVPHGVKIESNGVTLFSHDGSSFGQQLWQDATFKTNGLLDNEKFEASTFAVYPNPSTGVFNFTTEETIDVVVLDITGKTVHTAKGIENGGSINLSALQSGMYIAKIKGESGERVEKLIIK